jgi:hypothetical protein
MIISLENLQIGLEWWRRESKWGDDLANSEYDGIYADRSLGITTGWWPKVVDRLSKWRAYRGSKPPNKKEEITGRGASILDEVAVQFDRISSSSEGEPSIASCSWEDVAPLYSLAFKIKRSPVFAGKMCHFLFPNLFMVMDNWAIDVSDYEIYWRGMRDAWCNFKEQAEARNLLVEAIGNAHPPHIRYPFETKIMELCHIGHKHGQSTRSIRIENEVA